ncbi:methyl-accepting chemotaxis protein [Pseudothermotoga sp.]
MRNIAARLILSIVPLIVILLVVGNSLSYLRVSRTVGELTNQNFERLAHSYGLIISSSLQSCVNVAESLANTPMLKPILNLAFENAAPVLANLVRELLEDHSLVVIVPVRAEDRMIAGAGVVFDLSVFDKLMKELSGDSLKVILSDEEMRVVSHSGNVERGRYLKEFGYEFSSSLKKLEIGSRNAYLISSFIPKTSWSVHVSSPAESIEAPTTSLRTYTIVLVSIVAVVSVVVIFLVARWFGNRIKKLIPVFEAVRSKDLTASIFDKSRDEIGQICNLMTEVVGELKNLVNEAKTSAKLVFEVSRSVQGFIDKEKTVSREFQDSFKSIDDRMKRVAAASEEVNASMEEISSFIQNIARESARLLENSSKMRDQLKDGKSSISKISQSTEESLKWSIQSRKNIEELVQSSNKIKQIASTIQNISEQTNLLALNAAIEAARAGESGRGFAVVAEEIRKLANQTKSSVSQIESILAEIEEKVRRVVELTTSVGNLVEQVYNEQRGLTELLQNTISGLNQTMQTFESITSVVQQQAEPIQEVSQALSEVSRNVSKPQMRHRIYRSFSPNSSS